MESRSSNFTIRQLAQNAITTVRREYRYISPDDPIFSIVSNIESMLSSGSASDQELVGAFKEGLNKTTEIASAKVLISPFNSFLRLAYLHTTQKIYVDNVIGPTLTFFVTPSTTVNELAKAVCNKRDLTFYQSADNRFTQIRLRFNNESLKNGNATLDECGINEESHVEGYIYLTP